MPQGLFFDPKRRRFRVRLYRGHTVVHLSYHKTKEEALATYESIVYNRPVPKRGPMTLNPDCLLEYLTA